MPICSGDARHQSRKLSKMALNFGRFTLPNFVWAPLLKLVVWPWWMSSACKNFRAKI